MISIREEAELMFRGDECTAEIEFDGSEFGYLTPGDAPPEIRDAASDVESESDSKPITS